jgi:class 3 adenylate cyclase
VQDDKGSTLIACFGLPPVSHEDDTVRGVLAAFCVCKKLFELNLTVSVGITTGEVFCGVAGSKTRREYTVLGKHAVSQ